MAAAEDKYTQRRNELLDDLVVSMGGRVAEEIVFGDVTSGARGDIQKATRLARKMVCEWGMSDKMGMVEYGEHEDYVFLGRDISRARDYSEATAEQIDREVRKLVDDAYGRAKEILLANRDKLEVIAKALLEYETLDGVQIREMIEHGRLINPPPGPPPPIRLETCAGEAAQAGGRCARCGPAAARRPERRSSLTRVTPQLLGQALRDCSDWHASACPGSAAALSLLLIHRTNSLSAGHSRKSGGRSIGVCRSTLTKRSAMERLITQFNDALESPTVPKRPLHSHPPGCARGRTIVKTEARAGLVAQW